MSNAKGRPERRPLLRPHRLRLAGLRRSINAQPALELLQLINGLLELAGQAGDPARNAVNPSHASNVFVVALVLRCVTGVLPGQIDAVLFGVGLKKLVRSDFHHLSQ